MVFTLYDQPSAPYQLETFINATDTNQRSDYLNLAQQQYLPLLFYDEQVHHTLTKVINLSNEIDVQQVVFMADYVLARIPEEHRDFELAKNSVIARNAL